MPWSRTLPEVRGQCRNICPDWPGPFSDPSASQPCCNISSGKDSVLRGSASKVHESNFFAHFETFLPASLPATSSSFSCAAPDGEKRPKLGRPPLPNTHMPSGGTLSRACEPFLSPSKGALCLLSSNRTFQGPLQPFTSLVQSLNLKAEKVWAIYCHLRLGVPQIHQAGSVSDLLGRWTPLSPSAGLSNMGHAFDLHNPGCQATPSTSEERFSFYFGKAASSPLRACHSLLTLFPPGSRASDHKAMLHHSSS